MKNESGTDPRKLDEARSAIRDAIRAGVGAKPEAAGRDEQRLFDDGSFRRTAFPFEGPMPLPLVSLNDVGARTEFLASDFLPLEGEEFVRCAYMGILGRWPDPPGLSYWMRQMHSGAVSKVELLRQLTRSAEAAGRGARVWGLDALPAEAAAGIGPMLQGADAPTQALGAIGRWPVIGRLLVILRSVWQLPTRLRALGDRVALHERVLMDTNALASRTASLAATQPQMSLVLKSHAQGLEALSVKVAGSATRVQQQKFEGAVRIALARMLERQEMESFREEMDRRLASIVALRALTRNVTELAAALEKRLGSVEGYMGVFRDTTELAAALDRRLGSVEGDLGGFRDTTELAAALDRRLGSVEGDMGAVRAIRPTGEAKKLFDEFYFDFENKFRGTSEEVKARMQPYVALVRKSPVDPKRPLLDVGSGRGDWLALLKENGLPAKGVDIDDRMVEASAALGLDVVQQDALEYLKSVPPGSLGAVSGFHIIEHLPFWQLIALMDETLRVLAPGGVAFFETPNPENLAVAACNFYFDPTHLKPLPPLLMKYLMESRDFADVEIVRLNPYPPQMQLTTGDPKLRRALNDMVNSAQDYAVIGYRRK
jgi:SAM-dependent methyltransferase